MTKTLDSEQPDLRAPLLGIGAMFMAHGMMFALLAAYFPVMKAHLEADERAFAACLTALGLGSLLAMALTGALVRRFGSAVTTAGAALICGALFGLLPFLPTVAATAAALFALGAALGMTDMAMNVQASQLEKAARGNFMTRIHGCWSVGGIIGSLGAGAVIELLPPHVYAVAVGTLFASVAIAAASHFIADDRTEAQAARAWTLPPLSLVPLGLMAFLMFMATGGIRDWAAIYLNEGLGNSLSVSVQAFAAFSAATAVMRFLGDAIRNRMGNMPLLIGGGLIGFLALTAGLLAGSSSAFIVAITAVGLAHANLTPVVISMAGRQNPASGVTGVMAMGYGGFIVGPLVIGFVAGTFTIAAGLGAVAVASLAVAVIAWVLVGQEKA